MFDELQCIEHNVKFEKQYDFERHYLDVHGEQLITRDTQVGPRFFRQLFTEDGYIVAGFYL